MAQPGKDASPAGGAVRYERHRPKTTLLYQLVDAHYPAFADRMAAHGTPLPAYVQREFEGKPGTDHGFGSFNQSSQGSVGSPAVIWDSGPGLCGFPACRNEGIFRSLGVGTKAGPGIVRLAILPEGLKSWSVPHCHETTYPRASTPRKKWAETGELGYDIVCRVRGLHQEILQCPVVAWVAQIAGRGRRGEPAFVGYLGCGFRPHPARLRRSTSAANVTSSTGTVSTMPTLKRA